MKTLCYTNKRKGPPPLLKQAKFYIEECTKGVIKPQKKRPRKLLRVVGRLNMAKFSFEDFFYKSLCSGFSSIRLAFNYNYLCHNLKILIGRPYLLKIISFYILAIITPIRC